LTLPPYFYGCLAGLSPRQPVIQIKGTPAYDDFMTNQTPVVHQRRRDERLYQFAAKVLFLIETEIALMCQLPARTLSFRHM
jgi:hypothetical protein